jgi:hypothetical protein
MFRYGTAPGQAGGVAVITAARLMRASCRVMLAWSSPACLAAATGKWSLRW